jgi:hypothetical protein
MVRLNSDLKLIDELVERIQYFLSQDKLICHIDGQKITGYRSPDAQSIWIRDYSDIIRGARYFESDMKSVVQHFADTQSVNGRIFDYFTTFPEKLPCERENWTKYVRVPVEADVEFRFVKAAWICFQSNSDQEWLKSILPNLEKAIEYTMNDPQRWDQNYQMVKRAYTIDTWDFAYTAGKHSWLQFQINDDTIWGIFHGDNTGLYEALIILSRIHLILGNTDRVEYYKLRALDLSERILKHVWNGRFFDHFIKFKECKIDGVDESSQLSLSNPMAINRGVGTPGMAAAMLREYQFRCDNENAFAPWFSMNPPFPDGIFGDEKLIGGAYINGGFFPLAGGELSLLALENGFERYGLEQIMKYHELTDSNETYLWYFPDGSPATIETSTSPDAMPTDGWGSSAFLHAIIQGLAGITDLSDGFKRISFAPRWAACFSKYAHFSMDYPASGNKLEYKYSYHNDKMIFELTGEFEVLDAHIYIPNHCRVTNVLLNQNSINFDRIDVNESKYIDFSVENLADINLEVQFDIIPS